MTEVRPDGAKELINGWDWITRGEARRIASENGYQIFGSFMSVL